MLLCFFIKRKTELRNKQNILKLLNVSLFLIKTSLQTSTSTLMLIRNCACVQARSQHLTTFNIYISDESVTNPPVIHNVPIRERRESIGKCGKNKEDTVKRMSALQEGT